MRDVQELMFASGRAVRQALKVKVDYQQTEDHKTEADQWRAVALMPSQDIHYSVFKGLKKTFRNSLVGLRSELYGGCSTIFKIPECLRD